MARLAWEDEEDGLEGVAEGPLTLVLGADLIYGGDVNGRLLLNVRDTWKVLCVECRVTPSANRCQCQGDFLG